MKRALRVTPFLRSTSNIWREETPQRAFSSTLRQEYILEDQEHAEEMLDELLCPETGLDGLFDLEEPMETLVINVRFNRLELLHPVFLIEKDNKLSIQIPNEDNEEQQLVSKEVETQQAAHEQAAGRTFRLIAVYGDPKKLVGSGCEILLSSAAAVGPYHAASDAHCAPPWYRGFDFVAAYVQPHNDGLLNRQAALTAVRRSDPSLVPVEVIYPDKTSSDSWSVPIVGNTWDPKILNNYPDAILLKAKEGSFSSYFYPSLWTMAGSNLQAKGLKVLQPGQGVFCIGHSVSLSVRHIEQALPVEIQEALSCLPPTSRVQRVSQALYLELSRQLAGGIGGKTLSFGCICSMPLFAKDPSVFATTISSVTGYSGGPYYLADAPDELLGIHLGSGRQNANHNLASNVNSPVWRNLWAKHVAPTLPADDRVTCFGKYHNLVVPTCTETQKGESQRGKGWWWWN